MDETQLNANLRSAVSADKDRPARLSMFNVYIDIDAHTAGVYNTLHDSALLASNELLRAVRETPSQVEPALLQPFVDNRALVPADFDERRYFIYYLNKMKYSPVRASYIIMLTAACNLDCDYCFEGRNKRDDSMSLDIARAVVRYILDECQRNSSARDMDIAFYGGEPLLNREAMELICEEMAAGIDDTIALQYSLVSNLTLMNESDVRLMGRYPFSNVQVAIDGPREVHNRRRVPRCGGETFDLILGNITELLRNDLHVILILNFDKSNWPSYSDLVPLIRSLSSDKRLELFLNPISRCLCNTSCEVAFSDSQQEGEIFLHLYELLRSAGIRVQTLGQDDMLCMLNKDLSALFDPTGLVFKCGQMVGKPQFAAGDLFAPLGRRFSYEMITNEPWRRCLQDGCCYLPVCGGGCRARALAENGDLLSPYCRKRVYFDTVYVRLLKDHFVDLKDGGVDHGNNAKGRGAEAGKKP